MDAAVDLAALTFRELSRKTRAAAFEPALADFFLGPGEEMPEFQEHISNDARAALNRNRSLGSLAAAILVGGAAAAVMFLPGVTVEPQGPVDPPIRILFPSRLRMRTLFLSKTSMPIS
jgi:hypothetical protein